MADRIIVTPGFVRTSMQSLVWTDARNHTHLISTMEPSHAANTYMYLRERVVRNAQTWLVTLTWMSERGMDCGPVTPEMLTAARDEPRDWLELLPLVVALKSRFRRPDRVLPVAPESDEF